MYHIQKPFPISSPMACTNTCQADPSYQNGTF